MAYRATVGLENQSLCWDLGHMTETERPMDELETWYAALETLGIPSLFK